MAVPDNSKVLFQTYC